MQIPRQRARSRGRARAGTGGGAGFAVYSKNAEQVSSGAPESRKRPGRERGEMTDHLTPIETALAPGEIKAMEAAARQAAGNAHAPYSHFHVGAAALDEQGRIFAGCNVENASFGLTICAERNAVGAAVAAGARRLRAVAVYTPTEALTPPCGACRQVLAEFGPTMEVHLVNHDGRRTVHRLDQLLPGAFEFKGRDEESQI